MPGKPKSGPPYTDIPTEIYVVVVNPWGMDRNPRLRGQSDFDRIASWAQLALQQAGLGGGRLAVIECIYSMGTRDEVILQFEAGTDIIPLLGEHRWANIVKNWKGAPNDSSSTRVFIYNWRNNGDPATHNWTDNFPSPLPLNSIPAKSPYPPPSWTRPPPSLTNFVLPIPHPPLPPPVPHQDEQNTGGQQPETSVPPSTETASHTPPIENDRSESVEQPTAQDTAPSNLFRPYEPPSQHPSHARLLGRERGEEEAPSSRRSPTPPKLVKKLDPYELEEDALNMLRSPSPCEEDTKDVKKEEDIKPTRLSLSVKVEVKTEDDDTISGARSGYQPSQALIDAFNLLPPCEQASSSARSRTRDPLSRSKAASGIAPSAGSGYRPSTQLEAEINSFLLGATATAPSSSSGSSVRPLNALRTVVKREYEEDAGSSRGERKRIKVEEY